MPSELTLRRNRIDAIDSELLVLLNRRARLALKLARHKRAAGLSLRDRRREAEVLARVRASASGPLTPEAAERLFRAILSESRRAQAAAALADACERGRRCA